MSLLICLLTEVWDSLYSRTEGGVRRGMYITTLLLHPKSVGNIRLKSSKRDDDPLIDPKLLTCSEDVDNLVNGISLICCLMYNLLNHIAYNSDIA